MLIFQHKFQQNAKLNQVFKCFIKPNSNTLKNLNHTPNIYKKFNSFYILSSSNRLRPKTLEFELPNRI